MMRLRFLGTGTSYGVPRLACSCGVCQSEDPRNKRLRASVLFRGDHGGCLLIDTTPDLRLQLLAAKVKSLDQVLVTHFHADHVFGLDDLRGLTDGPGTKALDLWVPQEAAKAFESTFPYIFDRRAKRRGIPWLHLRPFEDRESLSWRGTEIVPLPVPHGRMTTRGFLVGAAAYLTDCSDVSEVVIERIRGCEVLVLDMLRLRPAPTHLHLEKSLAIAARVGARRTWFTHLSHEIDHERIEADLPDGVRLAYDGLEIEFSGP